MAGGDDKSLHAVMEKANEIGEISGTARPSVCDPECLHVDSVEGLRQVCDACIEIHMLLGVFPSDLSDRKDHIDVAAARSEFTLGF